MLGDVYALKNQIAALEYELQLRDQRETSMRAELAASEHSRQQYVVLVQFMQDECDRLQKELSTCSRSWGGHANGRVGVAP